MHTFDKQGRKAVVIEQLRVIAYLNEINHIRNMHF